MRPNEPCRSETGDLVGSDDLNIRRLGYGVMVTHKTLVLVFKVRALVAQLKSLAARPAGIMGTSVGAEDFVTARQMA